MTTSPTLIRKAFHLRLGVAACALALAACAETSDEDDLPPPVTPPVTEASPAGAEALGGAAEMEGSGNVPTLPEVRLAVAQCTSGREVTKSDCTASDDGTQFTCRYTLDGDLPESEREAIIAAQGDGFTLVEIPEDCATQ